MLSKLELYKPEEIQEFIKNSHSIREVLEKVGLSSNGSGGYHTIKRYINKYNLSHTFKEGTKIKKINDGDVNNFFTVNSFTGRGNIRKKIIKYKLIEYKCNKCGNVGIWQGEKISLQLEHKNGINNDHRLENLCFLCPNCHSQTNTFGSKNSLIKNKKEIISFLKKEEHNKIIKKQIDARLELVKNVDFTKFGWVQQVSNIWGVSHTQVRRYFNIYFKDIKTYKRNHFLR